MRMSELNHLGEGGMSKSEGPAKSRVRVNFRAGGSNTRIWSEFRERKGEGGDYFVLDLSKRERASTCQRERKSVEVKQTRMPRAAPKAGDGTSLIGYDA
ncbi:hypothetical protein N7478_008998 [Penicillium angulare]|uniref:uncharacterized protein n=1 Tax=Penicillium angulare TaxID=116970 RepID=UPI00253FFBF6|nr:uncharacterized protein N7478_008998 [Penicillium angulare]KAJ5273873.1 hypothetical protein N7478_008998 [Penicillium angulare]